MKSLQALDDSIYSIAYVSMLKKVSARYNLSHHIEDYFLKSCIIFAIQILLILFILLSALHGEDGLDYVKPTLS